jgi:DNA-binding transcriptional ArsR family regulator
MANLGPETDSGAKITIDQKTFKILASETRVGILKHLDKKQMTVSDLSRTMNMSKATMFEHLEKLIVIGLIKKIQDHRKWVYYKLTWKGKNILHPERTKIAIVLTTVFLCSILLIYLVLLNSGYELLGTGDSDTIRPTIEFVHVDDINENTASQPKIIIQIYDNEELDESSLILEYTTSKNYQTNMQYLTNWQPIEGSIQNDEVELKIPISDWTQYTAMYLYLKCTIYDNAGNYAENVQIEYIENIFKNNTDLSIDIADIKLNTNIGSLEKSGFEKISLNVKVHNTGAFNVQDVEVSIFSRDPDTDNIIGVDDYEDLIDSKTIDILGVNKYETLKFEFELNLSYSSHVWIAVDPYNYINETDESNNIVNFNIFSPPGTSFIPEFPLFIGIIITFTIINYYYFKRKKKCKLH